MFWMRADPLRGQVGLGWALEIETFLGPAKWHRASKKKQNKLILKRNYFTELVLRKPTIVTNCHL